MEIVTGRTRRGRRLACRRGLATVETALVLTLVLTLTLGLLEYGWMFWKMTQIHNAARNGARVAARVDGTAGTASTAVAALMNQGGMAGKYRFALSGDMTPGTTLTVTVSADYGLIGLLKTRLIPVPRELVGKVSMVKDGP